jgi:glucosamine--fructose-6-phosphate aminotransferase (isomerizing)
MCGIVGFLGNSDGIENVVDGLSKLEYRGYDSAGLAYLNEGTENARTIEVIKAVGHTAQLAQKASDAPKGVNICIGHTRWATHGGVSEINAHPHLSNDGRFAVVHNGIIENYKDLIEFLKAKGIKMKSETDTEVIPNLIQHY